MTNEEGIKRFWAKVDRRGPDECWPWLGGRGGRAGHGIFRINGRQGRSTTAHRVAFFLLHGRYPENQGCHTCDHPWCVNPYHVFDGTQKDNMLDAKAKGRLSDRGNPKLSERQVREVRRLWSLSIQQKIIAERFGITQGQVSKIVLRKTWAHVL